MVKTKLHWYELIPVNIYFFGLSGINQTLVPLVLPLLVQQFVGEARQGTYFGILRFWGLMAALLVQALIGIFSDRSKSRWGRRRPFIFAGTVLALLCIAAIGLSAVMEGMLGFWFLLAMYLVLLLSSNIAQAAVQGLIPDIVPLSQRGQASAVKSLFEVPVSVIFVSLVIAPFISRGNIWGGLFVLMGILVITMAITMLVREEPLENELPPLDWQPFLRLVLMTVLFGGAILGMREVVRLTGYIVAGIDSVTLLMVIMGLVGLLAMAVAVVIGVGGSIRISMGDVEDVDRTSFTLWVISRLAFMVGAFNLSGFTLYFLQGRLGYSYQEAVVPGSRLIMFVGISLLVSTLISGWLTDRFGFKRIAIISGFVATAGTLVMLIFPVLPLIYAGACIIGIATGLFYTSSWALGTELVPEGQAARYLGISNLAGAGAGAVGAYIGGPLADFFTVQVPSMPGIGYVLIFVLYALLFLLSSLILMRVQE
ncbi:MAG: MFS transporter [Anaerolineae bacterium]|nr:MFS transporter [Anaerolineae bacterium]